MHVKSVSDTFNYLAHNKHNIEDIKASLCRVMLSKEPVDAVFFTKGIYQSVTELSPLEDQLEFFHFMLNTNLLPPFTEVFINHLVKLSEKEQRKYRRLPIDLSFKSFNTVYRTIDLTSPALPNALLKMLYTEKTRLIKELCKEDESEKGQEQRFLYLQGLSYQGLSGSENMQWLLFD